MLTTVIHTYTTFIILYQHHVEYNYATNIILHLSFTIICKIFNQLALVLTCSSKDIRRQHAANMKVPLQITKVKEANYKNQTK